MATDGADFGRSRVCYGKAYVALRLGMNDSDVAESVVSGIEREIKWEKGAPAFRPAVDLIVLASMQGFETGSQLLLRETDRLARVYADSPASRRICDALLKVGLASLRDQNVLSKDAAAEQILGHLVKSRCDAMSGYATKHRTHSISETQVLIESIFRKAQSAAAFRDLSLRMLNATDTGLPAKAEKRPQIDHSITVLKSISLEDPL